MTNDTPKLSLQEEIGRRLAATRKALGLTQQEMAESINVQRNTLAMWETGKNMLDTLAAMRIADRYGVTLDWFFRGDMSGLQHSLAIKLEPLRSNSSRAGK